MTEEYEVSEVVGSQSGAVTSDSGDGSSGVGNSGVGNSGVGSAGGLAMTLSYQELWDLVEDIVRSEDLELYDIERASSYRREDQGDTGSSGKKGSKGGKGRSKSRDRDSGTKSSSRRAAFGTGGVVKVYLVKPTAETVTADEAAGEMLTNETPSAVRDGGVNVDDCAIISRRLSALDRFEEFLGEHSVLEVSSPGINRGLRKPKHFQGAVGERILLKAYDEELGRDKKFRGHLVSFVGGGSDASEEESITVKSEADEGERVFLLADISSARIDFDFSSPQDNLRTPQKKGKTK